MDEAESLPFADPFLLLPERALVEEVLVEDFLVAMWHSGLGGVGLLDTSPLGINHAKNLIPQHPPD